MNAPSVSQVAAAADQPRRAPNKLKPTETEAQRYEAKRVRERDRHRQRKAAETAAQCKRRLAKEKRKREGLRARLVEDEDAVLSLKEWCALIGVSYRQGRIILASGDGPVVTDISAHLRGVSRRHHREWQDRRSSRSSRPRSDGK
jgi:hypothetical protein